MGAFDHIVAAMNSSPVVRAFKEMGESGDFSRLDSSQAKRHHFLPQFLLRGFAHQHNGKDRLFQMETATRGARDQSTSAPRRPVAGFTRRSTMMVSPRIATRATSPSWRVTRRPLSGS
jgi:hypothetical protein